MKLTIFATILALAAALGAAVAPVAASSGPTLIKGDFTSGFCCFELTALGTSVIFVADDGATGAEVWRSNGTYGGTKRVSNIRSGTAFTNPRYLTGAAGRVFFAVADGSHGEELWRTDGTTAGTKMVKNIRPGSGGSFPANLTQANGLLYFTANDGTHGEELWRSDGTAAGTYLVKDLVPGSAGSSVEMITAFAGKVYFRGNNKLWRTDGTSTGTSTVKNKRGDIVKNPRQLTVAGGLLYYTTKASHLWRSDGTKLGTRQIATFGQECVRYGYCVWDSWGMTTIDSELFFTQESDTVVYGIWKSNGTAAGTQLITDLGGGAWIDHQTNIGGDVVLFNRNGNLYRTNGTAASTGMFGDPEVCYAWEPGDAVLYLGAAPHDGDPSCDGDQLWAVTNNGTGLATLGPVNDMSVVELEYGSGRLWIRMKEFGADPGELWLYQL